MSQYKEIKNNLVMNRFDFNGDVLQEPFIGTNLPASITTTPLDATNLAWDSTGFGMVHMNYVVSQTAFGNNDFTASGSIRIIINGNSTALVFLNDENRMEISDTNKCSVEFDADVQSNLCRLVYTADANFGIKITNIRYVSYDSGITP